MEGIGSLCSPIRNISLCLKFDKFFGSVYKYSDGILRSISIAKLITVRCLNKTCIKCETQGNIFDSENPTFKSKFREGPPTHDPAGAHAISAIKCDF
jgi:hypothetical protein